MNSSSPTRPDPPPSRAARSPGSDDDPSGPELAARFAAGDPVALAAIYREYAGAVWSVAFRSLGDRALADDSVQETFVRAWRAAASFDPRRPLGPWLFSIARRSAIDVRRREMRPTRGDHAPEADVAVDQPGVEEAWQRFEVHRALASLDPGDREMMRLLHLEGLTQREVAERLGLPIGTVKSRSHRTHRRLAHLLGHLRRDDGDEAGPAPCRADGAQRPRATPRVPRPAAPVARRTVLGAFGAIV